MSSTRRCSYDSLDAQSWWRVSLGAFAIALLVFLPGWGHRAAADHGSWTHHHLHYNYLSANWTEGYADIGASDQFDKGAVAMSGWDRAETTQYFQDEVVCNDVNEGCGYRKTVTRSWSSGTRHIYMTGCAADGSHELAGNGGSWWLTCSQKGLPMHGHDAAL